MVIGWLRDDKRDYLFLVNRSLKKKSLPQITLPKPARAVEEIPQDKPGKLKEVSFDAAKMLLQTSLEPGEGKLFVVKR